VQVVDPGRVRFHLKQPWPDFLTYFGTTASSVGWIVPKKYVEQVGDDGFKKAPVGAGPYRFVSFTPGIELVVEAFEGYWRKTPSVKRLVFKVMPDDTTRAAALKKGDVDVIFQVNGPVAEDLRRTPHVRVVSRQTGNGVFWLDLPDQWDPRSPWHDKRVRQAASQALDRQAVNQAESLGTSRLTGSIIPRSFEFALPIDPPPYDPGKAKQLLAEAGYPSGFDAGDFYPYPPLYAMGEALAGYLGTVGIRTRIRTMERAAFLTAWRDKKLKGVLMGLNGSGGNAATRLEAYVTTTGIYAYGVLPEVEDLFQRQAREIDRTKREALLHQIQRILHERVMHVPVYELSAMAGIGPRIEQAGVGLILGLPYSAPYEDVTLKKP
jgi:peptide/nickel transport system substrate-binding protein